MLETQEQPHCVLLKTNTTLTNLNLSGEDKKKKDTPKDINQQVILHFLFIQTGNHIGDTGATSLSESLKSNTTLTELNLESKNEREKTSINKSLFPFSLHFNR